MIQQRQTLRNVHISRQDFDYWIDDLYGYASFTIGFESRSRVYPQGNETAQPGFQITLGLEKKKTLLSSAVDGLGGLLYLCTSANAKKVESS